MGNKVEYDRGDFHVDHYPWSEQSECCPGERVMVLKLWSSHMFQKRVLITTIRMTCLWT